MSSPGSPGEAFASKTLAASSLAPVEKIALPLLVTGTAGVAGYNALAHFESRYPGQVYGLVQRDNWRLTGPNILACDAEDPQGLREIFERYRFGSVLDAAGNCALKACELDHELARRTNVDGAANLLPLVADYGSRLVHLSVDLVFSGLRDGDYTETDAPDPVTMYGKTMVEAEDLILRRAPQACILRISLPMGVSFNNHAGAIDWIQSRFRKGKPATLYFDEVRTPTYTCCLNRLFERVLASNLTGLYHAGGPRRLSLYQIAQVINRVGGYDPKLLHGCPRLAAGPIPPRAGNVSMDSSKLARALGGDPFDPWPLLDVHSPHDDQWHFDRPGDELGSLEQIKKLLYIHPTRPTVAPLKARPATAHA